MTTFIKYQTITTDVKFSGGRRGPAGTYLTIVRKTTAHGTGLPARQVTKFKLGNVKLVFSTHISLD